MLAIKVVKHEGIDFLKSNSANCIRKKGNVLLILSLILSNVRGVVEQQTGTSTRITYNSGINSR